VDVREAARAIVRHAAIPEARRSIHRRWFMSRHRRLAGSLVIVGGLALAGCSGTEPVDPPEAAETYQPNWESLARHEAPAWFKDAKLGIFIHWGVYSVPGWAPTEGQYGELTREQFFKVNPYAEWYMNSMRIPGSPTSEHHRGTYGEEAAYVDFLETFNEETEKWRPEEWGELFAAAGARYVVLTTKHHDGFTLWPSSIANPHRAADQQGARRDLVGELTEAVRGHGMRMGLYYSGGIDWSFNDTLIDRPGVLRTTAVPQTDEYARYADAHWRELIDRYQPDILWNDITYPEKANLAALLADYYNRFPEGAVNNRWGVRRHTGDEPEDSDWVEFADFFTPEYAKLDEISEAKWETCRGIGYSFGYNRNETDAQMISTDELVDLLVDITSKNGNLLLNVGPMADGTIPPGQVERLRGLGAWLAVNGEAIYGSVPWTRAVGETTGGEAVRFTRKGDALFAVLPGTPAGTRIEIRSLSLAPDSQVELLGAEGFLEWSQAGENAVVQLPVELPEAPAHTLRITPPPV
jgi:alpha-L-fucosidase